MIGLREKSTHPTDEEMLLVADRECSPRRAAKLRGHLAECPDCHVRMSELESTLAGFIALHEAGSELDSFASSRSALKVRMSEDRHLASHAPWLPHTAVIPRQLAGACMALLIVAGSVWAIRNGAPRHQNQYAVAQFANALPQKKLTPGVARIVQVSDLCSNSDSDNDPPVNPSLEQAVFSEYGVPVSSKANYEVDYLISPALGGTSDIQNLWPEPYTTASWGARAKDDLENQLHTLVCQGKLPLSTAQNEIAGDWIEAYKRYFHTDAPLSNAATLATFLELHSDASAFVSSHR